MYDSLITWHTVQTPAAGVHLIGLIAKDELAQSQTRLKRQGNLVKRKKLPL